MLLSTLNTLARSLKFLFGGLKNIKIFFKRIWNFLILFLFLSFTETVTKQTQNFRLVLFFIIYLKLYFFNVVVGGVVVECILYFPLIMDHKRNTFLILFRSAWERERERTYIFVNNRKKEALKQLHSTIQLYFAAIIIKI